MKMLRYLVLIISAAFSFACSAASAGAGGSAAASAGAGDSVMGLGARPASVQEQVDILGRTLRFCDSDTRDGFYHVMEISDEKIIRMIADRDDGKRDVYFMNFGSGRSGTWGKAVKAFLRRDFSTSSKHFHIINVDCGDELKVEIAREGNVTLYTFSGVSLENIKDELKKRDIASALQGDDLTNRFDLIVSYRVLGLLYDPWGTINQLYDLLTPACGIFLSTGFAMGEEEMMRIRKFWNILAMSSAQTLFRRDADGKNLDEFMMRKVNSLPLNMPLRYVDSGAIEFTRPLISYIPSFISAPLKACQYGCYYGTVAAQALFEEFYIAEFQEWLKAINA